MRIIVYKFQLNRNILKISPLKTELDLSPLCDTLMTFYNIAYVLSWLECHTYTLSQVSAQLEHFENFDFQNSLWPLNDTL